jgi:hypothetical protein
MKDAHLSDQEIDNLRDDVLNADPACESTDAELFTGPDLFEAEPDDVRQAREAEAKALCAQCSARIACLAYALAVPPKVGIWAGLTVDELRAARKVAA